jgi:hypothetical protein
MPCFSEDEPPGWGPRRITRDEIHSAFAQGWDVADIRPADIFVTVRSEPARGWFATIDRT